MSRRVRRTAEEARRVILAAAEQRLREGGPEAIRLQELAGDIGVSHPAILHHFGSRDALLEALGTRVLDRLEAELLAAFSADGGADEEEAVSAMIHVFEALSDSGFARLLAWRALSRPGPEARSPSAAALEKVTRAVHRRRSELARERGDAAPTREDTDFVVRSAAAVALGDGLFGPVLDANLGRPGDPARRRERFRAWFGQLLANHREN
jgi:AcrR family transcriptional regulator